MLLSLEKVASRNELIVYGNLWVMPVEVQEMKPLMASIAPLQVEHLSEQSNFSENRSLNEL